MNKILSVIAIFILVSIGYGQTEEFQIDYTVTYEISSMGKGKDTLTIGFDKSGKFLITDSPFLAKDLARSLVGSFYRTGDEANINLLLNVAKEQLIINFFSKSNQIFMKADLRDILPFSNKSENPISKKTNLVVNKTASVVSLLGSSFDLVSLYSTNDIEKPIYVAFDNSKSYDNNPLLQMLFNLYAADKNERILFDPLQKGLILYIKDHNNKEIIKAVAIDETKSTYEINQPFVKKNP